MAKLHSINTGMNGTLIIASKITEATLNEWIFFFFLESTEQKENNNEVLAVPTC